MHQQTQNFHTLISKNGKGWCHWLDPMNFIPVSKGNLYQMRRFCGISKDRQALSSPDTHQKPSWFTRNNMARDERGSVLNLMPSCSTSNWHRTKSIQHSKHSFVFLWAFFLSISALLSPNQGEKSPERRQRRQFTLHQEQGEKIRTDFQTR